MKNLQGKPGRLLKNAPRIQEPNFGFSTPGLENQLVGRELFPEKKRVQFNMISAAEQSFF